MKQSPTKIMELLSLANELDTLIDKWEVKFGDRRADLVSLPKEIFERYDSIGTSLKAQKNLITKLLPNGNSDPKVTQAALKIYKAAIKKLETEVTLLEWGLVS